MTASKVKPELPLTATVVSVSVTDASASPKTDASPAANDDSIPTVSNDLRNPLWIIAIGMACFFGITAAVIAIS